VVENLWRDVLLSITIAHRFPNVTFTFATDIVRVLLELGPVEVPELANAEINCKFAVSFIQPVDAGGLDPFCASRDLS
jgi:hypothetical protein